MEAVKGIDQILLFRLETEAALNSAAKLAFQTEHDVSESSSVDATPTKDGNIQSIGADESEISLTSILSKNDVMVKKLRDARRNREVVEVWDIDKGAEASGDKYPATYYKGYITDYTRTATAEDNVEVSFTFVPNGTGVDGEATLTGEQAEVVQYVFEDTTPTTGV